MTATSSAAAAASDLTTIRSVRGVPLFYERFDDKQPRPHAFPVARSFVPKLEAIVDEVRKRVPDSYGDLTGITSAGMFVGKAGRHGEGRACDFDRLTFEHVQIAPIRRDHAGDLARRRRYWAFVAICRSVCCFTLHAAHNKEHEDHVHGDHSVDVVFTSEARSTVTLVQSLLNVVHNASPALTVDGDYGPKTRAATAKAVTALGLTGNVTDRTVWIKFLRRSAQRGFELAPV
jgi:hypothetical protein